MRCRAVRALQCRVRWVVFSLLLASCRIGFDHRGANDDVVPVDDARSEAIVDVPFDDTAPVNCPQGYASIGIAGSKYKPIDNSLTWSQAQAACVADGTHLAIIDNINERSAVTGLLPTRDLWLGVTDRITIGTWRTVTGDIATYLPWDSSEPDADVTDRCVETEFPLYGFIDQDCTSDRRFVCECDGRASDPTSY